jgi:ATP-dependent Clp protease ATP-binding subunit ClpA
MLEEIGQSLEAKYQKPLHVTDGAADLIASQGYSEDYGVRHLRRTVQTLVEGPLSRLILSGELKDWQEVEVAVSNGMIILQPRSKGAFTETRPGA